MDTIPTALLSIQQEMCASFEHGNAAGVAAIYAEEGQMMPAHCTAISGRAAIQAFGRVASTLASALCNAPRAKWIVWTGRSMKWASIAF